MLTSAQRNPGIFPKKLRTVVGGEWGVQRLWEGDFTVCPTLPSYHVLILEPCVNVFTVQNNRSQGVIPDGRMGSG